MLRHRSVMLTCVLAAAASPLLAGCGGGGGSPGVANLASSSGAPSTTTRSGSRSTDKTFGGPAGPSGQFQIAMSVGTANGEKFSACMRKHGVTRFPDPDGQGVIRIHSGMGIDPGSPAFRSARSVCEKLLPNGGQPTPAQIAERQHQMLAFSSCMRAHGLKDFPDPSNGGLRIEVHPGSDLNPNNPTFQRAQHACLKYIPFKAPPGTAKSDR